MYYKLSFSRVVRKQSSDQTMVATTEDRGKLVRQKFFGFLTITSIIISITTTLVIIPGEKVRRRTWTKEEAEAAAKARLEVRRQEDNMKVVRWGWWRWWKHLQKIFERGGHMIIKGRGFSKDKQTTTINKGSIKTE